MQRTRRARPEDEHRSTWILVLERFEMRREMLCGGYRLPCFRYSLYLVQLLLSHWIISSDFSHILEKILHISGSNTQSFSKLGSIINFQIFRYYNTSIKNFEIRLSFNVDLFISAVPYPKIFYSSMKNANLRAISRIWLQMGSLMTYTHFIFEDIALNINFYMHNKIQAESLTFQP